MMCSAGASGPQRALAGTPRARKRSGCVLSFVAPCAPPRHGSGLAACLGDRRPACRGGVCIERELLELSQSWQAQDHSTLEFFFQRTQLFELSSATCHSFLFHTCVLPCPTARPRAVKIQGSSPHRSSSACRGPAWAARRQMSAPRLRRCPWLQKTRLAAALTPGAALSPTLGCRHRSCD